MSNARFCVASRTHACVAAYAAQVPTLAVGYSVKSAGIAADLGQSKFVLDADTLDTEVLLAAFKNLVAEEADIHAQLGLVMSGYIKETISPQILEALR